MKSADFFCLCQIFFVILHPYSVHARVMSLAVGGIQDIIKGVLRALFWFP